MSLINDSGNQDLEDYLEKLCEKSKVDVRRNLEILNSGAILSRCVKLQEELGTASCNGEFEEGDGVRRPKLQMEKGWRRLLFLSIEAVCFLRAEADSLIPSNIRFNGVLEQEIRSSTCSKEVVNPFPVREDALACRRNGQVQNPRSRKETSLTGSLVFEMSNEIAAFVHPRKHYRQVNGEGLKRCRWRRTMGSTQTILKKLDTC